MQEESLTKSWAMDLCPARGAPPHLEHLDLEAYGPKSSWKMFRSVSGVVQGFLCVRNKTLNMFLHKGSYRDDVSFHLQISFWLE